MNRINFLPTLFLSLAAFFVSIKPAPTNLFLLLAVVFDSFEVNKKIIDAALKLGVITDWFLFCDNAMRIAPPLNIPEGTLEEACGIIIKALEATKNHQ